MSTEYELNETPVEDWIEEGVSFLQANVTIYRNPAIYAQYQPLLEQIKALEAELQPKRSKPKRDEALGEETLGTEVGEQTLSGEDDLTVAMRGRLEELYTEAESLWKIYSEDVEVWTLRRVDSDEVKAIREEMTLPLPKQPGQPGKNPSKQLQATYVRRFEKFIAELKEYTDELNIRCLAVAVVGVVVKGEPKAPPSLEGLRRLRTRPGGGEHIRELVTALESLTAEGVNIMAPHRPGVGA